MKTYIFAALSLAAILAACHQAEAPAFSTPLPMQGSADGKSILLGNQSYRLTQGKSFPLIDGWIFSLPNESLTHWTQRIEVQRFTKVNAQEIYEQMVGATQGQLQTADPASRTVCFVIERNNGQLKEANVWHYTTTDGHLTYGNGILWQFPAGTGFNTFMKGEFPRTCEAMRTVPFITPPPLSN